MKNCSQGIETNTIPKCNDERSLSFARGFHSRRLAFSCNYLSERRENAAMIHRTSSETGRQAPGGFNACLDRRHPSNVIPPRVSFSTLTYKSANHEGIYKSRHVLIFLMLDVIKGKVTYARLIGLFVFCSIRENSHYSCNRALSIEWIFLRHFQFLRETTRGRIIEGFNLTQKNVAILDLFDINDDQGVDVFHRYIYDNYTRC